MQARFKWSTLILLVLLVLSCLISLNLGAVSIKPWEVIHTFLGNGSDKQELILFQFRLPGIILALMVGAGMAISGTILQSITRNELADPGILGINAGSGLAVIIYITFFQTAAGGLTLVSTFILPLFAFLGAILTGVLIMFLAWKKGIDSIRLILVGIGVNAGLSAFIIAFQLRLDPHDFVKAMVWLSGDLWAKQWPYVWALLPWFIVLSLFTLLKTHTLNILNLGTQVTTALGIRSLRERIILLITAVALAGLSVAAGGGIAFLGMIAPHISRRLVGPRHQLLIPTAALIGAIVLIMADAIGKNVLLPTQIPAGLIVSLVSVPYFVILLMKTK
ncbi:iron complex transport system permease protein [Peribacillus deserti]|uniref:Iron complex transport system permease protein n=1 Tax=Peribacillus deserti TaxID=673318 RepID=A0ABS2QLC5_9BACI|nr:iron ABC transporter permease [Peribacillus deserti]MBM7693041.1 iron complex transport system permease protein [Peribacillus deserti]